MYNYHNLHNLLSQKIKKGIFLLIGDDAGQISYCSNLVVSTFNSNHITYLYKSIQKSKDEILSYLMNANIFDNKISILIKEIQNNITKKDLEFLIHISSNRILLLHGNNMKKTSMIFKSLCNISTIINCYKFNRSQLTNYIKMFLFSKKIEFEEQIPSLIANQLDGNLFFVNNALEKICLYIDNSKLTSHDVYSIFISNDYSTIHLCYQILTENIVASLQVINSIKCTNIPAITVIKQMQNIANTIINIISNREISNLTLREIVKAHKPPIFFKEEKIFIEICESVKILKVIKFLNCLCIIENKLKKNNSMNFMHVYDLIIRLYIQL